MNLDFWMGKQLSELLFGLMIIGALILIGALYVGVTVLVVIIRNKKKGKRDKDE